MLSHQTTGDFEEQAALLQGWNQEYAQVSSGMFKGSISEMAFDDTHLFLEYSSQNLFQSGRLPDDRIAVGVPLKAGSNGMFCGMPCDQESMHVFSGSKGFEFFSPSQLMMGGISVRRDKLLENFTEEEKDIVVRRCDEAQLIKLDGSKISSVGGFMAGVFEMVQGNPALLENTSTRASLNKTVASLLTECLLENSAVSEKPISNEKCWSIIGQTRELVAQQSESPISVAELCRHLGVSRRTLQYCFTNMLGTSPVVYLRTERLNNVRRMLRTANSVTEAAAHWGFWHFGHFSQEYKRMFGELPSTTFKRVRNLN